MFGRGKLKNRLKYPDNFREIENSHLLRVTIPDVPASFGVSLASIFNCTGKTFVKYVAQQLCGKLLGDCDTMSVTFRSCCNRVLPSCNGVRNDAQQKTITLCNSPAKKCIV